MNILLLGSGGREHALASQILKSPQAPRLFVAPGNSGIAEEAECVPIGATDARALLKFAENNRIDLVVVGPEAPLVAGVADLFRSHGFLVFGPGSAGARLEASKAFTKQLLGKNRIPTAAFQTFRDAEEAKRFLSKKSCPVVVKADGLAAGKGVIIAQNLAEANAAVDDILVKKSLGEQSQVVIEDFLSGEEASFMVVSDGKTYLPLATAQDHKRIFDGDRGPNTGGMGAYSPAPLVTPDISENTLKKIIAPTFEGLLRDEIDYRGVLYAGLMIGGEDPFLLEYNVRFGDPECQAILPRLQSDFVELMTRSASGSLQGFELRWQDRSCVTVVLAAAGYPGEPEKGSVIEGIEEASRLSDVKIFHAGTARKDGRWIVNGGRVLGVTALGLTLQEAIDLAYRAVGKIHWKGMQVRKDIGAKGVKRLS